MSEVGSAIAPSARNSMKTEFVEPKFSLLEHFSTALCSLSLLIPFTWPSRCSVVTEYQRAVRLRFGKRVHPGTIKGGLQVLVPCVDSLVLVDVREKTINIPKQSVITKEGMSIKVDGVVYYAIVEAEKTILKVRGHENATSMIAQTKLREILGSKTFSEVNSDRERIAATLQEVLDVATDPWGIKVTRVEITDVSVPASMQRAMGSEAEALRNAQAKVIEAEGEERAAQILQRAGASMSDGNALQLRFLQTLSQISTEKNSTVILPFPMQLLDAMAKIRTGEGSSS